MSDFRSLDERVLHDGHIFQLVEADFAAPDGSTFTRDIVRHPGAVAVVPVVEDSVILVRQYRAPLDLRVLEIPAGLRDVSDEPLEETAQRELIEEIGMKAGTLEHLADVHNCIGFCDELVTIFIGRDLEPTPRVLTDSPEEAEMEILKVPIEAVVEMISTGEITDAKTMIGVLGLTQLQS